MKRSYMIHIFLMARGYTVIDYNLTGRTTKYQFGNSDRFLYVSKSKGSVRIGKTLKDSFVADSYPTDRLERWIEFNPAAVEKFNPEVIDVIGVY